MRSPAKHRDFQSEYRQLFKEVGQPLSSRDGIPESRITAAEKRLGSHLPVSLREYYLVAGSEKKLNLAFNRLYEVSEWELDSGKLVFMEENQATVRWGVTVRSRPADDPQVLQSQLCQGAYEDWEPEHDSCAVFLKFMICMHASFGGGLECTASAAIPETLQKTLDESWRFMGEVKKMRAYTREGQVVCFSPWKDFFGSKPIWRVFAGAASRQALEAIQRDLAVVWD